MAMRIMLSLAVKLFAVFGWTLAARRKTTLVSLAEIKMMIHVPIEMLWPVEPRSGANEDTALEPLRAIVTVWRTVIGRYFVITIRTNGRRSDLDRNLRGCLMGRGDE